MTDLNFDITNMEAAKDAVANLPRLCEITENQESAALKASEGTLFADMDELPRLHMQTRLIRERTEGYTLCSDLEYNLGLAAENDPEQLAKLTAISYRPEVCQRTAGADAINEYRELRQRFLAAANTLSQIENKSRATTPTQTYASKSGGCYVATAVYGSYDCPEVWTLRRYRDTHLGKTWQGRAFVRAYYAASPRLVRVIGAKRWFTMPMKTLLNAFVAHLNRLGFTNKPYTDSSIPHQLHDSERW